MTHVVYAQAASIFPRSKSKFLVRIEGKICTFFPEAAAGIAKQPIQSKEVVVQKEASFFKLLDGN